MKIWRIIGWGFFLMLLLVGLGLDWDWVDYGAQTKWQRGVIIGVYGLAAFLSWGVDDILTELRKDDHDPA